MSVAGCAVEGEATVVLHPSHGWGGKYPDAILYETALHEAMHALYSAHHSQEGLMCIHRDCYRSLTTDGWIWHQALRLRPLDHEVFTLYGSLSHGMTKGLAEQIVKTVGGIDLP